MRLAIQPSLFLLYWENDDYLNSSDRVHVRSKRKIKLISNKYQKNSFLFYLGKKMTFKNIIKWNINWKIDENISLVLILRNNQKKVYYEDG